METKSYLIDEHAETIFSNEEIGQWKVLVDELGLEKQAAMMDRSPSPLPFPLMTDAEQQVYTSVLNSQIDYKEYSAEAIPLKMLSLIALCEKEKYFDKIEIWYSRTEPDPLIIGKIFNNEEDRNKNYYWNMAAYLIGAWGHKLKSALDLLPSWDVMQVAEINQDHDYKMNEHQKRMERFRFQLGAGEKAEKLMKKKA